MSKKYYDDMDPREIVTDEKTEETTFGIVTDCKKLNIRKEPAKVDGNTVCEVEAGTELMIDLLNSTNEWYHVYNSSGLDGFCMKEFISLKQ